MTVQGLRAGSDRLRVTSTVAAVLLFASSASAQMPDKFTNLQFFPKDISKKELMSTMRGFSFSLGVRCEHCHVQKADKKIDFAADDKQEKKTARTMLKMVSAINGDYISRLPAPSAADTSPVRVECVTCHHGLAEPRTINAVMAETMSKKGLDAALTEYRELRKKYYGTARYDFGETPLNILTEALLEKKQAKEAAAMEDMNLEFNDPPSNWTLHVAGMAHRANGEADKAKKDFEAALKLSPDDTWAKDQLGELAAGPKADK